MAANEQCFTVQSVKEPLDMGLGMNKGGGGEGRAGRGMAGVRQYCDLTDKQVKQQTDACQAGAGL